ncbi:MAG: hypothetical protein U0Z44_02845 [Kouleothrix sp.]
MASTTGNGSSNLTFHVFVGRGLRLAGALTDTNWVRAGLVPPEEVWAMIGLNEIRDGLALTALLWHLARDTMPR